MTGPTSERLRSSIQKHLDLLNDITKWSLIAALPIWFSTVAAFKFFGVEYKPPSTAGVSVARAQGPPADIGTGISTGSKAEPPESLAPKSADNSQPEFVRLYWALCVGWAFLILVVAIYFFQLAGLIDSVNKGDHDTLYVVMMHHWIANPFRHSPSAGLADVLGCAIMPLFFLGGYLTIFQVGKDLGSYRPEWAWYLPALPGALLLAGGMSVFRAIIEKLKDEGLANERARFVARRRARWSAFGIGWAAGVALCVPLTGLGEYWERYVVVGAVVPLVVAVVLAWRLRIRAGL